MSDAMILFRQKKLLLYLSRLIKQTVYSSFNPTVMKRGVFLMTSPGDTALTTLLLSALNHGLPGDTAANTKQHQ